MDYGNPYAESELVARFSESGRLAVLDLDGTLVSSEPSEGERKARANIISMLKARHIPYVFSSARTPELMMSEGAYFASRRLGFDRPLPLRGENLANGMRTYAPLETLREFEHLVDPDAIIGFGTGIYLRVPARGGYVTDVAYEARFGRVWRGRTLDALTTLSLEGDLEQALAPLERETSFARGEMDVFPLPYRIQLEWRGAEGRKRLSDARFRIKESLDGTVELVDESKPLAGRYVLYVIPTGASKKDSLTWLVDRLCDTSGRPKDAFSFFVAGDTMTDLYACDAVPEADLTFVLAGRSPIGPYLADRNRGDFVGINLTSIRKRLIATRRPGIFRFNTALRPQRTFVIADEASSNASPVESVRDHLEEWLAMK